MCSLQRNTNPSLKQACFLLGWVKDHDSLRSDMAQISAAIDVLSIQVRFKYMRCSSSQLLHLPMHTQPCHEDSYKQGHQRNASAFQRSTCVPDPVTVLARHAGLLLEYSSHVFSGACACLLWCMACLAPLTQVAPAWSRSSRQGAR